MFLRLENRFLKDFHRLKIEDRLLTFGIRIGPSVDTLVAKDRLEIFPFTVNSSTTLAQPGWVVGRL